MIIQHKYFIKGKLDYCQYRGYGIQRTYGDSSRPFKILDLNLQTLSDRRGGTRTFSSVTTAVVAIDKELRAC